MSDHAILVTGAAGFIGARTVEYLLDQGRRVVGLDNLNDYYDVQLKRYRLARLTEHPGFTFHHADIEDADAVESVFASTRFDAVINLAARAGVRASIEAPLEYVTTNTLGTVHLLQAAQRHGVERYVMASTSSLYAGATLPFVETADVTRPISPYAASKLAAEAFAYTWHHLYGIHVVVLRYFTVYGPAGRPDMSPFQFIERVRRGEPIPLFGDGTQTRDFTYIDDIARGTVSALEVEGHQVLNLGGGNAPLSIEALISQVEQILGRPAIIDRQPASQGDMQDTAAQIDHARSMLEWSPSVPPPEGLRRTIQWHKENADWLSHVHLGRRLMVTANG